MAHLEIRQLSKRFGHFMALDRIDLSVERGEFLVLLGPSGCGKTTLLRAIAGLEAQDGGTIIHAGRDISRLSPARRDYGIVFQSYALFPNLTVAENVAYGLKNRRADRLMQSQRVGQMLTLVGLPGSECKFPAQLSGGQQQRIALARALATAPDLLLLDEPLSALDAIERVRLRSEIRALQTRLGVTTIMVTHDQEEALAMADRIVVMNRGCIQQIGTPHQIYRQPGTPFVADFIGRANILHAAAVDADQVSLGHLTLKCRPGVAAGEAVRLFVRPEDICLYDTLDKRPNSFFGHVVAIEYLGAYSLVKLRIDHTELHLTAQFSSNYIAGRRLEKGVILRIGIPAGCLLPLPESA